MLLLDVEHVMVLHQELVAACASGELEGMVGPFDDRARAGWDSIVSQLYPVFGHDRYPTLPQKAAWIIYAGATTQHLVDGNKRLTTTVALALLRLNGYDLAASVDDREAFVLGISTRGSDHETAIADAAEWIGTRLAPTT